MNLDEAMDVIRGATGKEFCPRMADVFLIETENRRQRVTDLQAQSGATTDLNRMPLDRGAPAPALV